jgi:hypothetical protein
MAAHSTVGRRSGLAELGRARRRQAVASVAQHSPQVDDLLRLDILVARLNGSVSSPSVTRNFRGEFSTDQPLEQ